jgi:ABC-2 type transport system ATP-binding protein
VTEGVPQAGSTGRPMLRADRLGRRFGDRWAIRDVSFEVRAGEVLGLLGPNGAGKTTTVRLLTALIEPTEGGAEVDGLDVRREPDRVRTRVGVLTESPGLYEKQSAVGNLEFFGRLHRLPADRRAARIERLLRLFGLWDRRAEPTGTYSKGMRQKLAIARALLHDPAVLFLDEPTAALDPESAFLVREAIAALRRDGRTIVLATHNLDEADRLCDRIAFVRGGLLRIDTPADLRRGTGPAALEVRLADEARAELLGAVRGLPGVAEASATDHRIDITLDDARGRTPDVVRVLVAAGADVLEVRPRTRSLEDAYFEVMGERPPTDGLTI